MHSMHLTGSVFRRWRLGVMAVIVLGGVLSWVGGVRAQSPVLLGKDSPLAVFVTNASDRLPEDFVRGSRWRFTTWTVPTALTWTATVNATSGGWANLTITGDDRITTTRWYYVSAMPGSWERI